MASGRDFAARLSRRAHKPDPARHRHYADQRSRAGDDRSLMTAPQSLRCVVLLLGRSGLENPARGGR